MAPLKQGSRGLRGVKEEWEGVTWHPHMDYLPGRWLCSPTIVSSGAVNSTGHSRTQTQVTP